MAAPNPKNRQRVTLRRSPKLSAFLLVFAVIGFFATLVVTSLYDADPSVGFLALFAYFSLYGITGTVALGLLVWLLLDLRSKRTAIDTTMARESHGEN
jgi:hypothetical protein